MGASDGSGVREEGEKGPMFTTLEPLPRPSRRTRLTPEGFALITQIPQLQCPLRDAARGAERDAARGADSQGPRRAPREVPRAGPRCWSGQGSCRGSPRRVCLSWPSES